jgi:hypothetical protein
MLAYIAGDNDLSDAGLEDVRELCMVGASPNVHVGVEIDTYGEHTGSIRYDITEPDWTGKAHRTVIERLKEKDSGDPRTLSSFIEWGFGRYRARNHLVVVWNHGTGFRRIRKDIGFDDFGSSLDMPEVETAFTRAGIGPGNRIGILGFDACLMNMVEIANHFKDQVDLVVGSQQTEPGDGWPSDRVLRAAHTARAREDLAKAIVRDYIKSYKATGIQNVTQSAVDCAKTESVMRALSALGDRLTAAYGQIRADVKTVRLKSQSFEMADYVDLVHLSGLLRERMGGTDIGRACDKVIGACRSAVLASERIGSSVKNANGLSVWFPAHTYTYSNYRAKYIALNFASRHTGWVRFLDTYHSDG